MRESAAVLDVASASECAETARAVLARPEKFVHIQQWGTPFFTSGVYHEYMSTNATGAVRSHDRPHGQQAPLLTKALSLNPNPTTLDPEP